MIFFSLLATTVTLAGTATVTTAAKAEGSYGARFSFTDTAPVWIEDGTPVQESRYRVRFYIKTEGLNLPEGDRVTVFQALDATQQPCFELTLVAQSGSIYLDLIAYDSNGAPRDLANGARTAVIDGYHSLELDWSAGSGNGFMALWLDGAGRPGLESLDNAGMRVELVRFGSMNQVSAGTFGHIDMDGFVSTKGEAIGPLCTAQNQIDQAYGAWTNGITILDLLSMIDNLCVTEKR